MPILHRDSLHENRGAPWNGHCIKPLQPLRLESGHVAHHHPFNNNHDIPHKDRVRPENPTSIDDIAQTYFHQLLLIFMGHITASKGLQGHQNENGWKHNQDQSLDGEFAEIDKLGTIKATGLHQDAPADEKACGDPSQPSLVEVEIAAHRSRRDSGERLVHVHLGYREPKKSKSTEQENNDHGRCCQRKEETIQVASGVCVDA
mmetsp:Transcript_23515/g.61858  ORF Transcript_23515/g.61858 Transcript_23515/m.61858 type:complete len:203 (-) Transcript_23515:239-847(-)